MWSEFADRIEYFFVEAIKESYVVYIFELLLFAAIFYFIFKVLNNNKAVGFIIANVVVILFASFTFVLAKFDAEIFILIIFMYALFVSTIFNAEIKRMFNGSHKKAHKGENLAVSGVEFIIEETVRAVQNMSKKDVGALIVLSNNNLPEGIVESGTVVNAQISSEMIEAVFYPKAPLHDGAMIIEGDKIYAAGCFLPLSQSDNLPKEMGSRHRAAIGVTTVANVTVIVVSEETGIISIVKNGAVKKKYADAADIKNALSDYYWTDLTAEGKL